MTIIDTIAATSTAPGPGAIAVLRVSGERAHAIAGALIESGGLPPVGRTGVRWLRDPATGERLDQVVVTVYARPRSYTGEDLVELSGHGGPLAPPLLLGACVAAGARHAEPGEFTRRAYLNGKLDLVQAEAVLDLVEGRSPALHRAALDHLDRRLSERLADLRERLVHLEALLVQHIDFPDEDEPPVSIERIIEAGQRVAGDLERLLATAPEGELLRDGAVAVFAGAPNSGKSTLFNALVGAERAIVTPIPGTTRDAIEARVSIAGYPFLLVDTAGLRSDAEEVERLGIEVAERYLGRADLVLLCIDPADEEHVPRVARILDSTTAAVLPLITKADLRGAEALTVPGSLRGDRVLSAIEISARTGQGVDRLLEALPRLVFSGLVSASGDSVLLTRRRHRDGIGVALEEVRAFGRALASGVPAEVASTHLRPAETALESLLGVIPRDEVLDAVFREFCIGK